MDFMENWKSLLGKHYHLLDLFFLYTSVVLLLAKLLYTRYTCIHHVTPAVFLKQEEHKSFYMPHTRFGIISGTVNMQWFKRDRNAPLKQGDCYKSVMHVMHYASFQSPDLLNM